MDYPRKKTLKAETVAKRSQFGARIRLALRDQLEAAARENGRSISEEAESRLEQSFLLERMMMGPAAWRLAAAFAVAGQQAAEYEGIAAWQADAQCYEIAALAAVKTMWAQHPKRAAVEWSWREWFARALDYVAGLYAPDDATRNDLTITAPRAGDFQAGRYDRERSPS